MAVAVPVVVDPGAMATPEVIELMQVQGALHWPPKHIATGFFPLAVHI
jgi:hypothetical protein